MVYYAPRHLEDAVDFLSNEPAIVLAGGTDVFPSLGERSLAGHVLDLSRLLELRAIDRADGMVRIGAAAPWSDIVATPLPAAFDALIHTIAPLPGPRSSQATSPLAHSRQTIELLFRP